MRPSSRWQMALHGTGKGGSGEGLEDRRQAGRGSVSDT